MKIIMFLGLMALFCVANAAPTSTGQPPENISRVKGEVVDFMKHTMHAAVARKRETEPQVAEIWTQFGAGIQPMMDLANAINDRELVEKIGELSRISRPTELANVEKSKILLGILGQEIGRAQSVAIFGSLKFILNPYLFKNSDDSFDIWISLTYSIGEYLQLDLFGITGIVEALNHVKYVVDSGKWTEAGKPPPADLEKIKAVVDNMIEKAMEYFTFAVGFLGQIGERFVAKGCKLAFEMLYIEVKAKIESGEDKNNIVKFLRWLKSKAEEGIDYSNTEGALRPERNMKMILTPINVAMQDIIEKAETNIEGLLETIITKIEEYD